MRLYGSSSRGGWLVALVALALVIPGGAVMAQEASMGPSCQPAPAEPYEVGSMVWNTSNPFYSNFIKGQEVTAECLGIDLDLQNGQGDLGTQVAVVQQFIAQGKDLIIVTPGDVEGIVPVILEANAAGIPVIAANNKVGEGAEVVTFVGANDYEFGRIQGEMLLQELGEEAKVGLILGALGTSAQVLREQGLTDFLVDHPGLEIIVKQTANWDNAQALAVTQDWLTRFPAGEITAIIDQGPEGVSGAQWASENGRTDVKFFLGDYPADVKTAIADGIVVGTVNQDPYPQGVGAIEYAHYWLSGQQDKVERPNHYLPLPIVTIENVDEYPAAWGAE